MISLKILRLFLNIIFKFLFVSLRWKTYIVTSLSFFEIRIKLKLTSTSNGFQRLLLCVLCSFFLCLFCIIDAGVPSMKAPKRNQVPMHTICTVIFFSLRTGVEAKLFFVYYIEIISAVLTTYRIT